MLENLEALLFGSFLGITRDQVLILLAVAAGTLAFFAFVGRPLALRARSTSSSPRPAASPSGVLEVAFLVVLGLSVAATAQITGVLLVFALLVAPAAAAQQLTARIGLGLGLSIAIALLVTWLGLGLAYYTDYSVGFYVTSLAFAVYLHARSRPRSCRRLGRGVQSNPSERSA